MLIDLPGDWRVVGSRYQASNMGWLRELAETVYGRAEPLRVYRGIYEAHINFEHEIENLIADHWPEFPGFPAEGDWFNSYGVVDHWTQLPLKMLNEDPRPLLVYLARHRREDQPEYGWRWHKWGPYLGVHEGATNYEYLRDALDVVEVFSYCIVELKPLNSEEKK